MADGFDDDVDPTGVRELLAGLPAPGPMPEALVARIQAALEHERYEPSRGLGTDDLEVALGLAPVTHYDDDPRYDDSHHYADESRSAGDPGDVAGARRADVVSLASRRRTRWPVLGAAAATVAALAIGGGFLVRGGSGGGTTASLAKGSTTMATTPVAMASANPTQKVQLRVSSRTYTSTELTQQAQTLLDPSTPPAAATDPAIGPIGTPEGLAACIATLGEDDADSISADIAVFDGQPAVIIVAVKDGLKQVYVVGRDCGKGDPGILQEGTPLN